MEEHQVHAWDPGAFALGIISDYRFDDRLPFLGTNPEFARRAFFLLILNCPLTNVEHYKALRRKAAHTVCADGGANRVYDLKIDSDEKFFHYAPNAIVGDMDSLGPEVRDFFLSSNTVGPEMGKVVDDYSTDFGKALKYIGGRVVDPPPPYERTSLERDWLRQTYGRRGELTYELLLRTKDRNMPILDIVVLGGLDGRADHAFSQIQDLFAASKMQSMRIGKTYIIGEESIMFLLEKGLNRIHTPVKCGRFSPNVGIIPIGRPAVITTRGLEWDVTDWPTEFGGQISTSNHIKKDFVDVETTEQVLFTLELAPLNESLEMGMRQLRTPVEEQTAPDLSKMAAMFKEMIEGADSNEMAAMAKDMVTGGAGIHETAAKMAAKAKDMMAGGACGNEIAAKIKDMTVEAGGNKRNSAQELEERSPKRARGEDD